MPTVSGSSGDDVESQEDEIKVFKYEGEEEDAEKSSSENLTEDKSSLITETEQEKNGGHVASSSYATIPKTEPCRPPDTPPFGLFGPSVWGAADRLGYFSPFPYPYTNGTSAMVSTPSTLAMLCSDCQLTGPNSRFCAREDK
ncbi:CTNNB1 binding N-teminal [Trinorchestia longiramus]|nr:CTNNB1 binding N-teminal [Trinorchestia longiramus]